MALTQPLKIAALDEEDLEVLSAHVQDAVVKVSDISWSQSTNQLIMPMNRFAWEETRRRKHRSNDERRRAVLQFDKVQAVRSHGVSAQDKDAVISILAILYEPKDAPGGTINIVCSADVILRIEVEVVEARLTDLGAAWSASKRPEHHTDKLS